MYFLTVLAMLATMEIGYRLTKARLRRSPEKTDAGVGGMAGASLALLATSLVGVQSAYGEKRNYLAMVVMVLILSEVFMLIVDLDRAQDGLLRVSQQPMINLQRQLNPSP